MILVMLGPLSSTNFSRIVQSSGEGMPDLDTLLFQDKKTTEDTVIKRIGAITQEGRMVGFGLAVAGPWDPILKPGYFQILVVVEEKFREQGVGGKIYQSLEQFATDHKAIALQGAVRESKVSNGRRNVNTIWKVIHLNQL